MNVYARKVPEMGKINENDYFIMFNWLDWCNTEVARNRKNQSEW